MSQTIVPTSSLSVIKWKRYSNYKDSGVEWLGEIPEHWASIRLKFVARLCYGDALPADARIDGDIPVFGSNGKVGFHSHPNTLSPVIIIGRKGSYGKINFSEMPCFAIDTTYYIDARSSKAYLRWLTYVLPLLGLDIFSEDSAIPGLSRNFAYSCWLPVPPLLEQHTIATFLDHHTTRINTLIAKKEQLIELLKEKRAALISQAVTKGLDPTVPMKDSGVEWLGEMPEHWHILLLKRFASIRYGLGQPPAILKDGIPLIRATNIKSGRIMSEGRVSILPGEKAQKSGNIPR